MELYKIIVTPDAAANLAELRYYIANILMAPDAALRHIRLIRTEIAKLKQFPARIAPVHEDPWHSRGIRFLIVKNFYVYYRIDENAKMVFILNVVYSKRDQLKVLAQMDSK